MKRTLLLLCLPLVVHAADLPFADDVPLRALSLVGTSYRPAGSNPHDGFDCSGFVNHVYREARGMQLPRDSAALARIGQPLARTELQAGDLVFFNTRQRPFSHVGIYLGENRFIHASSSRSGTVMISRLDEAYWARRYDGARRVDGATAGDVAPAPVPEAMDPMPSRLAALPFGVE